MRVKKPYIVIAFENQEDVLALEEAALIHDIPGRIIPLPSEVSAGCGMAWALPVDVAESITSQLNDLKLSYESINVVELY